MEFSYQAKNQTGQFFEGVIEASTENMAVDLLHGKGYIVLSLRSTQKDLFSSDLNQIFAKPNNKDVVIFTRQLATLIDADMPLAEGLRTLSRQVDKPSFTKIVSEISEEVEGGSSLSGALSQYPKLFSPFYVKLVRSGEASGKLQESLSYLADYLERTQDINSKIRGALAYPLFVVGAMIVVSTIMVVYVLPQLLVIFKESGITDLPVTTRILISVTNFVNNNLYVILAVVIAGGIFIWRYVISEKGQVWANDIELKLPIFGKILRNLYLARISESLSTLIKADISILDAIKITSDLVGNRNYQNILLDAEENVRGGGTMSEIFARYKEVPALLTSMVAIGEKTGKIEFMLDHVSKFFRSESEGDIRNLSQLIEPVLVFVLGIGVAILVSSILLPIYNLVGAA